MVYQDTWETIKQSNLELIQGTIQFLPRLVVALLLVLVGIVVARLISQLVGKIVDVVENSTAVKQTLARLGAKPLDVDGVVALFTKWTVLLIFLSAAVDVLGLRVLTNTFDSLVAFVPHILAASVVAGLTLVAGNVIHDLVEQAAKKSSVKPYKTLANVARIVVLVFGLPLAVAQLGLDITLLTNNITVLVAGVTLAFALAFGLGGREVAGKVLDDAYKNWKK